MQRYEKTLELDPDDWETAGILAYVYSQCEMYDKTILMDPKGQDFSKYQGVDVLVPNYEEAMIATKSSKTKPIKKIAEVLRKTADKVVITRSSKGAYYFDGVDEIELPAVSKDVVDATGAGGSFVAFFGLRFGLLKL